MVMWEPIVIKWHEFLNADAANSDTFFYSTKDLIYLIRLLFFHLRILEREVHRGRKCAGIIESINSWLHDLAKKNSY